MAELLTAFGIAVGCHQLGGDPWRLTMDLRRAFARLVVCGVMLIGSQSVLASDQLSFSFNDLTGGFDAGSSLFSALDDANTTGNVKRLAPVLGTANLDGTIADSGFAGMASFDLMMTLSNVTDLTADSSGTISITDLNGDTVAADISGQWTNIGSLGFDSASFAGMLSNVQILDNFAADGLFDGDAGSSFDLTFPSQLFGNAITLAFGSWFTDGAGTGTLQGFSDVTTVAGGAIVPEPATLALLAMGGVGVLLRRRKKA